MIITQFYKTNKQTCRCVISRDTSQMHQHPVSECVTVRKMWHKSYYILQQAPCVQPNPMMLCWRRLIQSAVKWVLCFKPCWWSLEPTALKLSLITQSWHYWFLSHNSSALPSQHRKWATEEENREHERNWMVKMQRKPHLQIKIKPLF